MINFWLPLLALGPLFVIWFGFFQAVRFFGGCTQELRFSLVLSILVTSMATLTQPGYALLWFVRSERTKGAAQNVPFLVKLCGLLTALSLWGAVVAALAIILAKLASQFDQGIVTQALQICFGACFSILGMLILPIPGSAILYLGARALPRFALSPVFSIAAFSLGIYGMTDLSTRTDMPARVFNEAACYLNTLMCIR